MGYARGDVTKLRIEIRDEDGALADPDELKLLLRPPSGEEETLEYSKGGIVRESEGVFYSIVDLTDAGIWAYRWEATGGVQVVESGELTVQPDGFSEPPGRVGVDYITREDLEAALGLGGEADAAGGYSGTELGAACTAASRGVDQLCNRRFWKDAEDQTRKYRTDQDTRLWIDDLASLTKLEVNDEAWTEDTDFELSPPNAAADGEPYTSLRALGSRINSGFSQSADTANYPPIKVTGKFGWPAVPQQVVTATTILASRLLKRVREAPYGALSLGMEGEAIATRIGKTDPEVSFLLAPFVLPVI